MPRPWLAIALVSGVVLAALCIHAAMGQAPFCDPRVSADDVDRTLRTRHGEHPVAAAVTVAGDLMRFYVSARGTWTVVTVTPRGVVCFLSAGEGFQFVRGQGEAS